MNDLPCIPLPLIYDSLYLADHFEAQVQKICEPFETAPAGAIVGIYLTGRLDQHQSFTLGRQADFVIKTQQGDMRAVSWNNLSPLTQDTIATAMMGILQDPLPGNFEHWAKPCAIPGEPNQEIYYLVMRDVTLVQGVEFDLLLEESGLELEDLAAQDLVPAYHLRADLPASAHEAIARSARLVPQIKAICDYIVSTGEMFQPTLPNFSIR